MGTPSTVVWAEDSIACGEEAGCPGPWVGVEAVGCTPVWSTVEEDGGGERFV